MAVRVLNAELVEPVGAERRHDLSGNRVHRVEEVGLPLQCIDSAAAVVRRVVVELNPPRRGQIAAAELIVRFADRELRRLHVRHRRRLRLQSELRHDPRRNRERARRGQIAARLFPAAIEEQLVLDDRTADIGRTGVDARIRLLRAGSNRRTARRDHRAAAAEEERKRTERTAAK